MTRGRTGRQASAVRSRAPRGPVEELTALHETALALIQPHDLDAVLGAIVERAARLVGTDHGYLYIADRRDGTISVRVGRGIMAELVGYTLARGEGVGGRVWASGEPLVIEEYGTWAGRGPGLEGIPIRSVVGVPLVCGGEVAGVLGLVHVERDRAFDDADVALLTRFGRLASLALEQASLYAAAQQELLERRRTEEELVDTIARLRQSESELSFLHEEMIRRLSHAAEFRSAEMGAHVDRMSRLCGSLAEKLGLDEERCELIRLASPLHDVGKIAIPDRILLKPGPLTDEERSVMQRHAEIGYSMLTGSSSELLELVATIALTHHERYDGTGYPNRLAGIDIPLEGRIAAVADVFDALTSERVYRPALDVERALETMRDGCGTQFDPSILELLLESIGELDAPVASASEPSATAPPAGAAERRASKRAPRRCFRLSVLEAACRSAIASLAAGRDDREAIDLALDGLRESGGEELLPSVYLLEHDRIWLVAQRGYTEVRDGFSTEQGVIGRAVRTGEPQLVADTESDPEYVPAMSGIRSELAVPLRAGGAVVGALNVETTELELPPEALGPLSELAEAIAPRIASIGSDLAFDLARLARLCVYASSLRGVGAIAEFAVRTLGRVLGLEAAQISLTGRTTHRLASFWRRPDSTLRPLDPLDVDRVAAFAEPGEAAFGVIEASRAGVEAASDSRWLVWLLLRVGAGRVGILIGRAATPPTFEHEQGEAATLFAQHAAALIDVASALRREQRAAVTDALTGLLNQRGFERRVGEELERAARRGRVVSVVLLDCSAVEEVNDRGGRAEGDRLLRLVADCLRANKRSTDVAARVGGDEFGLLLPDTEPAVALKAADRLRRRLRTSALEAGFRLRARVGVAGFPADGDSVEAIVRSASERLDGRNGRTAEHVRRLYDARRL